MKVSLVIGITDATIQKPLAHGGPVHEGKHLSCW